MAFTTKDCCGPTTPLLHMMMCNNLFKALASFRKMPKRQLGSEAQAEIDQLPLKTVKLVNMDASPRKER